MSRGYFRPLGRLAVRLLRAPAAEHRRWWRPGGGGPRGARPHRAAAARRDRRPGAGPRRLVRLRRRHQHRRDHRGRGGDRAAGEPDPAALPREHALDLHPGRDLRPGPGAVRRGRHRDRAAPRVRRGPHPRLSGPALPAAARAPQHQHRLAVAGEQQPGRPLQPGAGLQPRPAAVAAGPGQLGGADVLRARGGRRRRADVRVQRRRGHHAQQPGPTAGPDGDAAGVPPGLADRPRRAAAGQRRHRHQRAARRPTCGPATSTCSATPGRCPRR